MFSSILKLSFVIVISLFTHNCTAMEGKEQSADSEPVWHAHELETPDIKEPANLVALIQRLLKQDHGLTDDPHTLANLQVAELAKQETKASIAHDSKREEFDVNKIIFPVEKFATAVHAVAEKLRRMDVNVDMVGTGNRTPLHVAARDGNFLCVAVICTLSSKSVSAYDNFSLTPLNLAAITLGRYYQLAYPSKHWEQRGNSFVEKKMYVQDAKVIAYLKTIETLLDFGAQDLPDYYGTKARKSALIPEAIGLFEFYHLRRLRGVAFAGKPHDKYPSFQSGTVLLDYIFGLKDQFEKLGLEEALRA